MDHLATEDLEGCDPASGDDTGIEQADALAGDETSAIAADPLVIV